MTEAGSSAWLCTVCGFVHRGDSPPDVCPVCGAQASDFEPHVETPLAASASAAPEQWRCINCGYIHEGSEPPDVCPLCGVGPDEFEPVSSVRDEAQSDEAMKIIVIGGGVAGVAAAEAARKHAPKAMIHLLCRENRNPYYRLNLTRYLAGEIQADALQIHPDEWYSERGIHLQTGCPVVALDTKEKKVVLAEGKSLVYDSLVLAMGSHAFVPPVPGSDLEGVMTLRTAGDADAILKRARAAGRCVVIGGGVLGIEAAGALARQGVTVTLIESHAWLMPRQLNRKAAGLLERHMGTLGITLKKEARTERLEGEDTVSAVCLADGTRLETGVVVLATGVRSNTSLARKAGLEVNRGIVVNNHLQASADGVYAAGDVAEHNGQVYGTWAPSQFQGAIAGLNAAGQGTEFGGMPRANTLKILGIDLLSMGQFEPEDGSYRLLDHEEGDALAHFVFRDGRLVGSILMGYPALGMRVKNAIEIGEDFSAMLTSARSGQDVLLNLKAK